MWAMWEVMADWVTGWEKMREGGHGVATVAMFSPERLSSGDVRLLSRFFMHAATVLTQVTGRFSLSHNSQPLPFLQTCLVHLFVWKNMQRLWRSQSSAVPSPVLKPDIPSPNCRLSTSSRAAEPSKQALFECMGQTLQGSDQW